MKQILIILTAMFLSAPLYAKATAAPIGDATENWLQGGNDGGDDEEIDGELRGYANGQTPKGTLQLPVSDAYYLVVVAALGYGVVVYRRRRFKDNEYRI